uniref:Uncharacterized protein n=1 Tax=Anguilla anguilla TaxID=7936 RepID=A0A0E9PZM5_ANGAN
MSYLVLTLLLTCLWLTDVICCSAKVTNVS